MPGLRAGRAGCGRERGTHKTLARWSAISSSRDNSVPWYQVKTLPGLVKAMPPQAALPVQS